MGKLHPFFLLVIVSTAIFGAGIADVVFSDVIPLRPYSHVFQAELTQVSRAVAGGGLVSDIFGVVLIIVLASSLFGTIANFTTGRTIAHAGFTVNPNITSSTGLVPVIQLIPFAFASMVLLMVYAVFERRLPGGL